MPHTPPHAPLNMPHTTTITHQETQSNMLPHSLLAMQPPTQRVTVPTTPLRPLTPPANTTSNTQKYSTRPRKHVEKFSSNARKFAERDCLYQRGHNDVAISHTINNCVYSY